jgi:uncharacterized protein RhaS with RHS repeats
VRLAAAGLVHLIDPDGTRHRFRLAPDGVSFTPPPGVNLHLRRYSLLDLDKQWAITRADGVTHVFDALGYETQLEDRNGNVIRYEYELRPGIDGETCAPLCPKRVTTITDSAGVLDGAPNRQVRVRYWPLDSAGQPGAAPGKIREIVDHADRVLAFNYDADGFLTQATQAKGTSAERSFRFQYAGAGLVRHLSQVTDPRNNHTQFAYEHDWDVQLDGSSSLFATRAVKVTDRTAGETDIEAGWV